MERIWIYQSNRKLSTEESNYLLNIMGQFTEKWTAHGKQLSAGCSLKYNQFLIVYVNENFVEASGCSIDKLTDILKKIQEKISVDFFDRMQIAYRQRDEIHTVSREIFENLIESGQVNESTIVFNNMAATRKELEENWEVPLKVSWHARVFSVSV